MIAGMVILSAIGLCLNIPGARLSRSILALRIALTYPPQPLQADPLNVTLNHLYRQYARVLVVRRGLFLATACLALWYLHTAGFNWNTLSSTLRIPAAPVPPWAIVAPAYILVMIQVLFHSVYLGMASEMTVILLIGSAYLAGVHPGWLFFPCWMAATKLMHVMAALSIRKKEAWWNEFLRQHGFVPYLAYRVLARR